MLVEYDRPGERSPEYDYCRQPVRKSSLESF